MNIKNFPKNVQQVIAAVLTQGADTSADQREEIMSYAVVFSAGEQSPISPPAPWQPYIDTVIKHAYRVTDKHTERLQTMGKSEDEIFEMTVSAALGAGLARLERGFAALEETEFEQASHSETAIN